MDTTRDLWDFGVRPPFAPLHGQFQHGIWGHAARLMTSIRDWANDAANSPVPRIDHPHASRIQPRGQP
jgi:hypothetical protein